jgi:hypothetical protein
LNDTLCSQGRHNKRADICLLGKEQNIEEITIMARGNQRDLARARNKKKQEEQKNSAKKGDYHKRIQNDGDILREKQRIADEKKAAEAAAKLKK